MQKNNTISIVAITLIIGLVLGYAFGNYKEENRMTMNQPTRNNTGMMQSATTSNTRSMQDMMASMNAGLQEKNGDSFDQEFLSEMITHHQGAVAMAQFALTNAKHQEIKDLANEIIAAQNKEIVEMQQWQKTWYGK